MTYMYQTDQRIAHHCQNQHAFKNSHCVFLKYLINFSNIPQEAAAHAAYPTLTLFVLEIYNSYRTVSKI